MTPRALLQADVGAESESRATLVQACRAGASRSSVIRRADDRLRTRFARCGATTTQAWPASLESMPRSMPIFCIALVVFAVGVLAEDQLGIGRAMQPAVMLDLLLELARRPAGIAERQDGAVRALAARDRLENVERRGEADAFVDRQRRVLDEEVARMQHEAALGIDRPALEHLHAAGARRQLDEIGRRNHVELHQQVGKADMRAPAG